MVMPEIPTTAERLALMIDASLLRPEATRSDVEHFLEESILYNFAAVFLHPAWIADARQIIKGSPVKLGIAVGYPHGAHLTKVKLLEIEQGQEMGAEEFDMVANIGRLRSQDYLWVANELERARRGTEGKILKVIIETGWLTEDEKRMAARIVADAGCDFVKTSTGIVAPGATAADVKLLYEAVNGGIGVKASGGVRSFEQAMEMIRSGASRIGTSQGRTIVEEAKRHFADR